jgi:hypothetical protein
VRGADIIHRVIHSGAIAGTILYDSKNRARWTNNYVSKLRDDQREARADFAILSTTTFPRGVRQLHVIENVIIASPARVVALSGLLRRQVVLAHVLRMSNQARDEKKERLFDFVTSERCAQLLDRFAKLADDMTNLEVKEVASHQAVWRKRGEYIRAIQKAYEDVSTSLSELLSEASE